MFQLTPEDRERIGIYAADITAQRSTLARDEILVIFGKVQHDIALYESMLADGNKQMRATKRPAGE